MLLSLRASPIESRLPQMNPPPSLVKALSEFDRGLRVRWSEALGKWCIERRHGWAGLGTDAVLRMLHFRWKRLEREAVEAPGDLDLALDERAAYDEFISRREGYQPIFYCWPNQAELTDGLLTILLQMDIRRAGGPSAWAQNHKDAQQKALAVRRAARRERIRMIAEEAFDRAQCQKDFHAQGGDPFMYQWDRK